MDKITLENQFQGNFMEALHLPLGKKVELTIKAITPANTEKCKAGKLIDKPIVYFEETSRGLILNKTNAKAIAKQYGGNFNKWRGQKVILEQKRIQAFGKDDTPAIRVFEEVKINNNPQDPFKK